MKSKGFLQMCADRRFHHKVQQKFQQTTGLSPTDYWIEARAGGAPAVTDFATADYAYNHGAKIMAWAAHGDNCGGFPGKPVSEMQKLLDKTITKRQKRYPGATHFRIFSTEEKTTISKL